MRALAVGGGSSGSRRLLAWCRANYWTLAPEERFLLRRLDRAFETVAGRLAGRA